MQPCPLCDGTGWKAVGPESARRVARCDCRTAERGANLLAAARIPRRYEQCELGNFETRGNESLSRALLVAQRFVDEYPVDNTGLLLVGDIGVGKTHLAVGILKDLILTKGVQGLFYDYRELLKEIQNSYNPSVQATEMQVLRPVFDAEVLVLDELGAVRPTEWVWDAVSHILNTRYNDRRTTLLTTNLSDQPAAAVEAGRRSFSASEQARRAAREETLGDRIGERMRSRLHEMCRNVEMRGSDFRQHVRSASFR
jgi:DNA replication protein DnaC